MEIKSSRNGEITLSFTDIGKSYPSHQSLMSQICLLTLFAKIKFSRKFPDLQYMLFEPAHEILVLISKSFHCKHTRRMVVNGGPDQKVHLKPYLIAG